MAVVIAKLVDNKSGHVDLVALEVLGDAMLIQSGVIRHAVVANHWVSQHEQLADVGRVYNRIKGVCRCKLGRIFGLIARDS